MQTKNNTTAVTRGRPRHKVTIPSKGRFTIKSIGVFNKKVARPVIVTRLRELLASEKIRIVDKVEKKIKTKGRKSFIFEVVNK